MQKELKASKDKEHQLQTQLDKMECVSETKNQQISELTEELQVECKRMVLLATQELERQGKARVNITFIGDK